MRQSLARIAALVETAIAADPFPDGIRPEYLKNAVRDYPLRHGKRLRPALVFWFGTLFAPDAEARLLLPAAAVEVFHNWTLVHDDLIDRDDFRRGEPACHIRIAEALKVFPAEDGERRHLASGFAMLAGDLQQAWAVDLMFRSVRSGVRNEVASAMAANMLHLGSHELISGEALDMELAMRPPEEITPEEADAMIDLKTGALLRLAAETGVMAALQTADRDTPEVAAAGRFALHCGRAFQMRDDLLGIYGTEELGKPIGNDLREAKRTPLLLTALKRLSPEGRKALNGLLHRERYTPEMLDEARRLIAESGAKAVIEERIEKLAHACGEELKKLPDTPPRRILAEFAEYLVDRTR